MSISSIGSAALALLPQQSTRVASDGDSAAVEARETTATKKAEKLNDGFTPKATAATPSTAQPAAAAPAGRLDTVA